MGLLFSMFQTTNQLNTSKANFATAPLGFPSSFFGSTNLQQAWRQMTTATGFDRFQDVSRFEMVIFQVALHHIFEMVFLHFCRKNGSTIKSHLAIGPHSSKSFLICSSPGQGLKNLSDLSLLQSVPKLGSQLVLNGRPPTKTVSSS